MAKTNTVKKGFLQQIPKKQKISLIILAILGLILPVAVLLTQFQTRLSPRAASSKPIVNNCSAVAIINNYISCPVPVGSNAVTYNSVLFSCNGKEQSLKVSKCTTKTDLISQANAMCSSLCKVTVTPTTKTGVNSFVIGDQCKIKSGTTTKKGYQSARYQCYGDGNWYTAAIAKCSTLASLQNYAKQDCLKRSVKPTPTAIKPSINPTPTAIKPTPTAIGIGAEVDSHGCHLSAGYKWCEATQKCLGPQEKCIAY